MTRLQQHLDTLTRKDTYLNTRDNLVQNYFEMMGDRYRYDFDLCPSKEWKQYDTRQDAEYFGIWVNLETRQTLTYCEGDVTLVTCRDDAHLKAELDDMESCYGPTPPSMWAYDLKTGEKTSYIDPRPTVEA